MTVQELKIKLPTLSLDFIEEILEHSSLLTIKKGQEIIKQDGFIPGVPIVLEGLVNVSSRYEDRSLLLYYIAPGQSCVMSFSACLKGIPSQVFAITEAETTALLLPLEKVQGWLRTFPSFNSLFYTQFDSRYTELLGNLQQVLFEKIDHRLYTYLKEKSSITGQAAIKMTHQEIASELGTVREVISRTLKKLEAEDKLSQTPSGIKITYGD